MPTFLPRSQRDRRLVVTRQELANEPRRRDQLRLVIGAAGPLSECPSPARGARWLRSNPVRRSPTNRRPSLCAASRALLIVNGSFTIHDERGDCRAALESLDFLYMPSRDVVVDLSFYSEMSRRRDRVRDRGLRRPVAQVRLCGEEPRLLLADHLDDDGAVLVYRWAISMPRSPSSSCAGSTMEARFGIPHGPSAAVRTPGRPAARAVRAHPAAVDDRFAGRLDFGGSFLFGPLALALPPSRVRSGMAILDVNAVLGKVGLPAPLGELARESGTRSSSAAATTGSTAAAYLARAGRSVLVLERREQLGGACTLERPFRGPALPGQPLRLRRRAARRAGDPRARARAARLPRLRRPTRTSGARSRRHARARCFLDRERDRPSTCARNGFARARHRRLVAYEDALRPDPRAASPRAARGHLARRLARRGPRSRSCSATTPS